MTDNEKRLEAALRGCLEHMEWSTPQGRAAYEEGRAALKELKQQYEEEQ